MKRVMAILLFCLLLFTGCEDKADGTEPLSEEVVEISEKLFIAQTNDIYLNYEDYLGKSIKYEGLFMPMYWGETDTTYNYVIRYGPGCCGDDGQAGFEIKWDGEMPADNDWCEVIGVLEVYEEDGYQLLRLDVNRLKVLEVRGNEFIAM